MANLPVKLSDVAKAVDDISRQQELFDTWAVAATKQMLKALRQLKSPDGTDLYAGTEQLAIDIGYSESQLCAVDSFDTTPDKELVGRLYKLYQQHYPDLPIVCSTCGGSGSIPAESARLPWGAEVLIPCPDCSYSVALT